jgi:hypothetical protein
MLQTRVSFAAAFRIELIMLAILSLLFFAWGENLSATPGIAGEYMSLREGTEFYVGFSVLHPTQKGLGFVASRAKADRLGAMSPKKLKKYLLEHPVPVVVGPDGKYLYLVDHHHLSLACHYLGIEKIRVRIIKNRSHQNMDEFIDWMKENNFVYLFDEFDRPINFEDLPSEIPAMSDDPFRSLAGVVQDKGAYIKTKVFFMEFIWARFFRRYFTREEVSSDFDNAVERAIDLSISPQARELPGFIGRKGYCKKSIEDNKD